MVLLSDIGFYSSSFSIYCLIRMQRCNFRIVFGINAVGHLEISHSCSFPPRPDQRVLHRPHLLRALHQDLLLLPAEGHQASWGSEFPGGKRHRKNGSCENTEGGGICQVHFSIKKSFEGKTYFPLRLLPFLRSAVSEASEEAHPFPRSKKNS